MQLLSDFISGNPIHSNSLCTPPL